MTKYTLQATDGDYATTVEFEAEQLDDILMYMKMFIQGAGFTWVQGDLQFVEDDHAPCYYDFGRNV